MDARTSSRRLMGVLIRHARVNPDTRPTLLENVRQCRAHGAGWNVALWWTVMELHRDGERPGQTLIVI